ncbi:OmpA family protein [Rhodobacteraceae bacterium NNCM2]|nr:OmpA family protein [Coraliihabitans acroporae]
MKTLVRLMLGASAIAVAGCSQLPGSSLGATFSAERYLKADHGGPGFTGALASEYTELGRRAAFEDVRWLNSTAYINKAKQAEAGIEPAPWAPDQLGVGGEATSDYQMIVDTIAAYKGERPVECAHLQAMWDQYLEALRGGPKYCITPDDAKALLDEALAACLPPPGPSDFTVYFGFDRTDLTEAARATLDEVTAAVTEMSATALSIVGYTDTVGSASYNQTLSERRARRVAEALVDRGVSPDGMTLAGRGKTDLAVPTADQVREPLNRRVTIAISN